MVRQGGVSHYKGAINATFLCSHALVYIWYSANAATKYELLRIVTSIQTLEQCLRETTCFGNNIACNTLSAREHSPCTKTTIRAAVIPRQSRIASPARLSRLVEALTSCPKPVLDFASTPRCLLLFYRSGSSKFLPTPSNFPFLPLTAISRYRHTVRDSNLLSTRNPSYQTFL
ncbi:hypothetical protein IG631_11087 [Alternaria alternata]|nr:hypothetical protein IG631_11087 [Alternaria alternata]